MSQSISKLNICMCMSWHLDHILHTATPCQRLNASNKLKWDPTSCDCLIFWQNVWVINILITTEFLQCIRKFLTMIAFLPSSIILLLNIGQNLGTPISSTNSTLPACYRVNVAYDIGQSIASKTTKGPEACQAWCQVIINIFSLRLRKFNLY